MADTATAAGPVDLDSLSKKQLAKQFKSVAKEIKSKDLEVKTNVLEKLKNHRYFFEGGCLLPFFESLTPKKKTLDLSLMTLQSLLSFLRGDASNGRVALSSLRSSVGSLSCLEQLGACNAYHEVPKKAKKGQPPNVENGSAIELRLQASTALYELTVSLNASPSDTHLRNLYSNIPNIIPNLCQGLKCLLPLYENDETRENSIPQLNMILYCLSCAVTREHVPAILSAEAPELLRTYLKEKKLSVYCLNIIYKLNLHPDAFCEFSLNADHRQVYLATLKWTVADMVTAVGAGAADAPPAKDAKGGKAAKPPKGADPNSQAADAEAKADGNRALASQIKLLVALYLIMSTADSSPLSIEEMQEISQLLLSISLNTEFWKLCNACIPASCVPGVSLEDTPALMCSLLGSFAQRDGEAREAVCALNALDIVSSALLKSRTICDVPGEGASFLSDNVDVAEEDFSSKRIRTRKAFALFSLRRSAEKALMHLMTETISSEGAVSCVPSSYPWEACCGLSAGSSVSRSDSIKGIVAKLAEAIVGKDEDLANRIVRLLSGVIQCKVVSSAGENAEEEKEGVPPSLCTLLGLDSTVFAKQASSYSTARATALTLELAARIESGVEGIAVSPREKNREAALTREAEMIGVTLPELMFFKWETAESRDLRVPRLRPDAVDLSPVEQPVKIELENVGDDVAPVSEADENMSALIAESKKELADYLIPSADESLAHGLYLLEALLPRSAEVVTAACSEELVKAMVSVMYICGPTGAVWNKEHMAALFDPRIYNWREEHDNRNEQGIGLFSMIPVRGLAASVLTIIAQADAKYRTYEGEIPCMPMVAIPASASTGYAAASIVCKLASDVCFSSLLANSQFSFNTSGSLMCGPAASTPCTLGLSSPSVLHPDVLDSLLSLAAAIGSCGLVGHSNCYSSIASCEEANTHSNALSTLRNCLQTVVEAGGNVGIAEEQDVAELIRSPLQWTFPLRFEYFGEDATVNPISAMQVLSRKDLWPFIATAGAIIGTLSDPRIRVKTAVLASEVLRQFSRLAVTENANQPAIMDLFTAVFVAMGGCTALMSSVSCFGALSSAEPTAKASALELLVYMISRGSVRQECWDKIRADKLAAEAEATAALEAAGGKAGKKDDKKVAVKDDKKGADKGKKGAAVEEEKTIEVPFQPDESHADPNHGPSCSDWAQLLNIRSNCYISRSDSATPLTNLCQSILSPGEDEYLDAVLPALLAAGVDVDALDGAGVSALMYALILGRRTLVDALLGAGASCDVIDSQGFPTVAYAFVSINTQSFNKSLQELVLSERRVIWGDISSRDAKAISCSGSCDVLEALLEKGVDLQVSTSAHGNFPLHFACGLAELGITIGGIRFVVDNRDYSAEFGRFNTAAIVGTLMDHGASAKVCNKAGLLPLHICAASGDVASAERLLRGGGGELANFADSAGYLPIHFAAAACPRHAFEIINTLLKWGDLRPLGTASFHDARTGLSSDDKYWIDLEVAMAAAMSFGESAGNDAVSTRRVTKRDIVRTRTNTGLCPLHLVLAGRALAATHLSKLLSPWDNVGVRVAVAEMLISIGGEDMLLINEGDETDVATCGLSAVHTLALLGVAEEKPNTFVAGSLAVCSVEAAGFLPPSVESEQKLFVKLQCGSKEIRTTSCINTAGSVQSWNSFADSLLEFSSIGHVDMTVSVWSGECDQSNTSCIGAGVVSLGTVSRGQLLVGEEITLLTLISGVSTAAHCGTISVTIRTVNDTESRGISGPIFSNHALFSRILKSVDNDAKVCNSRCSWKLSQCRLPDSWMPLHGCIISQNRVLATALIGLKAKAGLDWSDEPYLQFVAKVCPNMTFCAVLIEAYGRLKPSALNKANNGEYPLHAAVRSRNAALVGALVDFPKVNLNTRDSSTGSTAFLEACRSLKVSADCDIFSAFERNSDRLDFLMADNDGESCIDFAIRNKSIELVELLCRMRRNDVVEKVTSVQSDHNDSVLLRMESDNVKLTKIVHADLFEAKLVEPVVKNSVDEEEEESASAVNGIFSSSSSQPSRQISNNKEEVANEEEAIAEVEVQPGMSVEEAVPLLAENEQMLSSLLKCVLDSSVAPPADYHVHECFAAGSLLRAHQQAFKEAAEQVAELAAAVDAASLSGESAPIDDIQKSNNSENKYADDGVTNYVDRISLDAGDPVPQEIASPIHKELGSFGHDDDGGGSRSQEEER